ncbi:hypothetical protein ACJJTC_004278 [Scirpophaga incertulas]
MAEEHFFCHFDKAVRLCRAHSKLLGIYVEANTPSFLCDSDMAEQRFNCKIQPQAKIRRSIVHVNRTRAKPRLPHSHHPRLNANHQMDKTVYAIGSEPVKSSSYECTHSIGFRHSDGKISKINALVQKKNQHNYKNIELTVQDLIDSNIDSQHIGSLADNLRNTQYSNVSDGTNQNDCPDYGHKNYVNNATTQYEKTSADNYQHIPEAVNVQVLESQRILRPSNRNSYLNTHIDAIRDDNISHCSVYYHKKIRGEKVRFQRTIDVENDDEVNELNRLPRIAEVFSKFNNVQPTSVLTQPVFVEVSKESERILGYPNYAPKAGNNTNLLESFYNFKNEFLVTQPLLKIVTTNCTKSVYSTSVISTP